MSNRYFFKKFIKIIILICFLLIFTNIGLCSEIFDNNDDDQMEFEQLMSIIEKYSDIATKTRLNVEYVPGILTVIKRDEMEKAGFKTVEDVLMSISSINIYIDSIGVRNISIRGVSGSVGSGNVKFMVNNISVIDSMNAIFDLIFDYPVCLLERIEVIRGPGSALYGEYAYSGVINIITRNKKSIAAFELKSLNSLSASAILDYYPKNEAFHFNALIHQYQTDGSDGIVGPDAFYAFGPNMQENSLAPGATNEKQKGKYGIVSFEYNNFSCTAQSSQIKRGDFMGPNHYLNNLKDDTPLHYSNHLFQITQKIDFKPNLEVVLKGGRSEHKIKLVDYCLFPPKHPFFPDGFELNSNVKSKKNYGSMDINYHFSSESDILLGVEYYRENFLIDQGKTYRHVFSLFSQYELKPIEDLSFTLGFRYDKYSNTEEQKSPRFSAVYRLTSNHIFKFQYANAFRPPTLYENYIYPNIKPPTIKTYELCYTYKDINTMGKISLYHSTMKNFIDTESDPIVHFVYFNINKVRSRGVEFELEQILWDRLRLITRATHMYTKNLDADIKMPFQTDFIANAGITYSPFSHLSFSTQYLYIGNRSREFKDNRKELSGYHKFNISMLINIQKICTKVRAGLDNIFNEDVRVPTPTAHLADPRATYIGDYPRYGRMMWFDIVHEF